MREHLLSRGVDKRATYIERLLWEIDPDLQEEVPKLTLNVDDRGLFRQIITEARQPRLRLPLTHTGKLIAARDEARKHVADVLLTTARG